MQSESDNHAFEMSLRDQLIAAQNGPSPLAPTSATRPTEHYPPPRLQQQQQHRQPGSAHAQPNLDPSMGAQHQQQHVSPYTAMPTSDGAAEEGDLSPGSKKAAAKSERPLSTTKRAAQNRAAQRAFRQRKEQYITKLEDDIKNYRGLEQDFRTLQQDNNALRNYIMVLQGKLSGAKIDFPSAPATVRVAQPNPVVYDLGEPSPPSANSPPAEQQSRYTARVSPDEQRYHPELRQPSRHYQESRQQQEPAQQYQQSPTNPKQPSRQSQPQTQPTLANLLADEALPTSAINQLRAAAVQAGEIDSARASRTLPAISESYTASNDEPPAKRQRLLDEEARGSGPGSALSAMLARFAKASGYTKG